MYSIQVKETNEEGFTGSPSSWFDDQEFESKQLNKELPNLNLLECSLKDEVKILSFKIAIESNPECFQDKVNHQFIFYLGNIKCMLWFGSPIYICSKGWS
jgi:hypothetical protein